MELVELSHRRIDLGHPPGGVEMDWVTQITATAGVRVHFASFAAGDTLPRHPTPAWQVFAVVAGSGWVAGDDDERRPIGAGTAAVWSPGEEHTSWARTPMSVVIVQSEAEPTVPGA